MANIEKRGKTYRIRVSAGVDGNGKRITESINFTPTAKSERAIENEVANAARDFEKRVKEGKYLSGEKMTFRAVTEHWKAECASKSLSDGGADYMKIIERYAYPAFGGMKISKIAPIHLQSLINDMENRGLAPKTIHRDIVAINSVFRYAYRMNIIQENPTARCELPKIQKDNALHYFTKEEAMRFLNEALTMDYEDTYSEHDRTDDTGLKYHVSEYTETHNVPLQFRALYALAIFGGFRRGEMAALTWKDIDWTNHTVTINKATAHRKEEGQKGRYIIKTPKTAAGVRIVTLPASCFDLLMKWKKEEMMVRMALGSAWEGALDFEETYIFIQAKGQMIHPDTIGSKFQSILERYNASVEEEKRLPIIRLHDLRHTSATLMIGAGSDIVTVSHRLGHSKPSVTLDIYSHPLPENDVAASRILEEAIALNA